MLAFALQDRALITQSVAYVIGSVVQILSCLRMLGHLLIQLVTPADCAPYRVLEHHACPGHQANIHTSTKAMSVLSNLCSVQHYSHYSRTLLPY